MKRLTAFLFLLLAGTLFAAEPTIVKDLDRQLEIVRLKMAVVEMTRQKADAEIRAGQAILVLTEIRQREYKAEEARLVAEIEKASKPEKKD